MFTTKKILFVAALALLYVLSAGCGGSDSSTTTGGPSTVYTGDGGDDGGSSGGTLFIWLETPSGGSGAAGDGEATISWTEMTDAESYNIYYSTDIDTVTSDQNTTATAPPKIITGLTNGTTYYFVIAAVKDGVESNKSDTITVTPALSSPTVPGSFSITAGNRQNTISWGAVAKATSYKIYWDTTSGITKSTPNTVTVSTTSYTHTGLTNYTTYYYAVSALNSAGEGNLSGESSAQPGFAEVQKAKPDVSAEILFGESVSMDGDFIIVGAPDYGATGAAYIYKLNGSTWELKQLINVGDNNFGESVAIKGNYAIIGDPTYNDNGAAFVFKTLNNWETYLTEATLVASDGEGLDFFGWSVAINDDYVAVGAPYKGSGAGGQGGVYYWALSDLNTEYKIENPSAEKDSLGWSVAVEGNYILAGAPTYDKTGADNTGALYFIDISVPASPQIGSAYTFPDYTGGEQFGISVALDDTVAIAGTTSAAALPGAVMLYRYDNSSWTAEQKITSSAIGDDRFGSSVSINGNRAVVGAYQNDDVAPDAGAAFVFKYTDTWQQVGEITASDGAENDQFGKAVAIGSTYMVVGAPYGDGPITNSGVVYLY